MGVGTSSALEILPESKEILLQWGITERLGYAMEYGSPACVQSKGLPVISIPLEAGFCLVWWSTKTVMCPGHQTPHCSPLLQNSCSVSPSQCLHLFTGL